MAAQPKLIQVIAHSDRTPALPHRAYLLKRVVDVLGASVGLLALGPVLLGVALAIRVRMGRPVIFRQLRAGLHKEPFVLLKFRTMSNAKDEEERLLPDRLRLTKLGAFLRATSLDELPQLWNVLRGDVSLVGPRPMPLHYLEYF